MQTLVEESTDGATTGATPLPGSAPVRSLQQRMDALARANDIRSQRARFKQQMKAHGAKVQEEPAKHAAVKLLTEVPEWADSMKVHDLLMAIPRTGRVKVNKLLQEIAISPSKTVGGMTCRQRDMLVDAMQDRC